MKKQRLAVIFQKKKNTTKKNSAETSFAFQCKNKPPPDFFQKIDFHYIEIPTPKDNKPEFRKSITISRTDAEINSA